MANKDKKNLRLVEADQICIGYTAGKHRYAICVVLSQGLGPGGVGCTPLSALHRWVG